MKTLKPRRPSASLVISMLALVVALGGTAYAAATLPKNSVGTKQLKNKAVTTSKIANGAVTGAKVNLSTLGTVPSARTAGSATTAASATSAGNATTADNALALGGAPSSAFLKGTITVIASGPTVASGSFGIQRADCPAGYQAVGGGVDPDSVLTEVVTMSNPIVNGNARMGLNPDGQNPAATGWAAAVLNNGGGTQSFKVGAICAPTG
jgi:hypothetical protein